MKKYRKRLTFNTYCLTAVILILPGVVFAAVMYLREGTEQVLLSLTMLPLICVFVFFAFYEFNCRVCITDKDIYFGHRVFSDERKYDKRGVKLNFKDIERVSVTYYRVQDKKPRDENLYNFVLRDGSEVKTYFYEYGEKAEKEILAFLETKVRINY